MNEFYSRRKLRFLKHHKSAQKKCLLLLMIRKMQVFLKINKWHVILYIRNTRLISGEVTFKFSRFSGRFRQFYSFRLSDKMLSSVTTL